MLVLRELEAMQHYDWIIVGSGFGGSVSALRLSEKGYRVLVIEKGRRFQPDDFAESNRDFKRWIWNPKLGLRGIIQFSAFRHVTIMHGVGVGGGSLTYACTLPTPSESFFSAPSWRHLADWQQELAPHYRTAKQMLGVTAVPELNACDEVLREIAEDIDRPEGFQPAEVSIYFGSPNERVPDPYFGGRGPDRVGCTQCGACTTGCRVGAKNTLDRNYLHLGEGLGAEILAETEVTAIRPSDQGGYTIETRGTFDPNEPRSYTCDRVVLAGGVLGTVPLLLQMKRDPAGLPNLSPCVGKAIRTNSEAIVGLVSTNEQSDFSSGVTIGSVLQTDPRSHLEAMRFGPGSGLSRIMMLPHTSAPTLPGRLTQIVWGFLRHPLRWVKALSVRDHAKKALILLYMQAREGNLRLRIGRGLYTGFKRGVVTELEEGATAPTPFIPEATELASRFAAKVDGVMVSMVTESLFGTPSTAHVLGGACMGDSADTGVIDHRHQVFGYPGIYVIDGAAVSANPGVNPSLTITALAERAMSFVPPRR